MCSSRRSALKFAEADPGGEASGHARATSADPWDGRPSREAAFTQKLQAAAPKLQIKDLDPIIDAMRFVKSPREIALMREVTRITGLGIMEAMREAAPGKFEYELTAASEWVFRRHNSQGPGYFPLSATGPNTVYSHYHRGLRKLQDGDIVQFDYAPDYKYYTSDISRVFPANGKFSARQREFYDDLPAPLSGADVVDPARCHHHAGRHRRRRENGHHHRGLQVHRSQD